jgi:hypothetical protein
MVAEQEQVARFQRFGERSITRVAGSCFEAGRTGRHVHVDTDEIDTEFRADELTMAPPRCGMRIQTMVDVERNQATMRNCQHRGMQQNRRIEAAAEAHDDTARARTQNRGDGFFDRRCTHAAERR